MKEFLYYPGCTLFTKAQNFDEPLRRVSEVLGFTLKELTTWNCCGAIYVETRDDITAHIAPIRNLIQAKREGGRELITACAACYNVLKRSQSFIFQENNPDIKERLFAYLSDEMDGYNGDVRVLHYLELLKEEIGFARIKGYQKLNGLKIGCYYGCLLTRPKKVMNFDAGIMERLFSSLGAEIVDSPFSEYCCGGYILLAERGGTLECVKRILNSFLAADVIITSCPLCLYNLDRFQRELGFNIPVLYFSQLLGINFGLEEEILGFEQHSVDPSPILEKRGLYGKL